MFNFETNVYTTFIHKKDNNKSEKHTHAGREKRTTQIRTLFLRFN